MIKHPDADCENCTLNQPINSFVRGSGPDKAKLVIVGEAPGRDEAKRGRPFTGPSGKLLDAVLEENDVTRGDVYFTNTVLCRPPDNRTPTKNEVKACSGRLQKEIADREPIQIVCLGATAAQALLDSDVGITSLRIGPPKASALHPGVEVIPTFHPAYCLREGSNFPSMQSDFKKLKGSDREPWKEPIYKVFDDDKQARLVLLELQGRKDIVDIVTDIEVGIEKDTDFDHPERYGFLCVGIGYAPGKVVVIGETALKSESVRDALNAVFEAKRVWCHNGKFDLAGIRGIGIVEIPLAGDTMLASYILDERSGTHGLGDLSQEILGAPDWKHALDQYVGSGKKKLSYANVPRPVLYKYNAFDVACTFDLMLHYIAELDKTPKFRELHDWTCRVSDTVQHMESKGIRVDQPYFDKLTEDYIDNLTRQEDYLSAWVVNPRSPMQVKSALHDMGIRTQSTDDQHLESILRVVDWEGESGKFVLAMRKYRKDQKMYGTYIKGMGEAIYRGRLHGNFLLHGSRTGRWVCKKPNLLNIPRGKIIKSGFLPDEGDVFVQVDLKTAELRVVGTEADCPYLIDALSDPNRDIHGEVADVWFGPGWSKDDRVRAKAVVFGLGYGREPASIAEEFDISVTEAQAGIDSFFSLIPEVKQWQADVRKYVWSGKDLVNAFGRMRRFHLITKQNQQDVGREALAFIPQSTANDINQRAAYLCWHDYGMDIRLCVHDSMLINVKPELAEETAQIAMKVQKDMALTYANVIPFYSDASIGNNWGELS